MEEEASMSDRLRSALPLDAADVVLQEMEAARGRQLPVAVLERRALELAAQGVRGAEIVEAIAGQHRGLWLGREALRAGGRATPSDDEVEAARVTLEHGVDDAAVSALVRSVSADRSLAVPLAVVSSLMGRGLPADDVVAAMHVWLASNASDSELHDLAGPPVKVGLAVVRGEGVVQTKQS